MKNASTAAKAILAAGQYLRADLYDIALTTGTTLRYTSSDGPLKFGANTYLTGLTIKRGKLTQKAGLEVQSLGLDVAPQGDNPGGAPTIGGLPFLSACRAGLLDGARVLMSKAFLTSWADTSPGAVPWFQGRIADVKCGRFAATLSVNSDLELLNVSMPRNLVQTGCVHTLFDAGCTLVESSFHSGGTVAGISAANVITTTLADVDDYYSLGRIKFTSGVLNGRSFAVRLYKNTGGTVTTIMPLTGVAPSDTFIATAGCDKQQATCSAKFANLAHYRGYPYVPVPETLYDGGTANGTVPTLGGQGGAPAGSPTYGAPTDIWTYPPGS
jgi:uncharacterized phage protein (TIGR02218 family)